MRKILFALSVCVVLASACTKSNNTPDNGSATNGFKVVKGGNGSTVNVSYSSVIVGNETVSQGTYYSFRGFFSVGSNSTYDRLAISFKTEPAVGTYQLTGYSNLPADKASMNVSYDSFNYLVNSGSVTVSIVNGKKKVDFSNLVLESGIAIPGTAGTKLPDNSTVTGSIMSN